MNQLIVHKTELDTVLLIEAPTNFHDFRGEYIELYNRDLYHQAGITADFRQDDISVSSRHVLRGLHGDRQTTKLISCLFGKFYLVIVNNDPNSPQYRKWIAVTLSDRNRLSALIPPKHANGHLVMSEMAIFHYKQDTVYDRAGQFTLLWNDPDLDIWWPVRDPIVSRRDAGLE